MKSCYKTCYSCKFLKRHINFVDKKAVFYCKEFLFGIITDYGSDCPKYVSRYEKNDDEE